MEGLLGLQDSSGFVFNPEGGEYDYSTAIESGGKQDESGHWFSIDPRSGMILKGRNHPTWHKTVEAELGLGNKIIKISDRYYSVPKSYGISPEMVIAE